jgi:hypothetical protein
VLQEGKSSGFPPYHAVFSVMLDEKQLEIVKEAVDGKRNRLAIRYDVTREIPVVSESVKRAETKETVHDVKRGGSWSSALNRTITSASRETVIQTEGISAMLDAADWPTHA